MTPLTGTSIIAGADALGDGPPFTAVDPSSGETLAPDFHDATAQQVVEATRAAAAAEPVYRNLPLADRASFLDTIAEEIEGLGDELLERAHAESGLPMARVTGERGRTCAQLRLFAGVVRQGDFLGVRVDPALPDRTPLPRPDLRVRRIPVGPVAVFGASNFPLAFSVAGGDTASALAAGCPVVVKGHPAHPGTSELVARAVTRAAARTGMPAGVFSLLVGRATAVGQALVTDPRIKAVGFTGSRGGGVALVAAAAARPEPIPVYAEMSSTNPVVLLDGGLQDPASLARDYVASLTKESGQFCTNPGLLLVPTGAAGDAFLTEVGTRLSETDGQPMLTPGIAAAYAEGAAGWADVEGVDTLAVGRTGPGPNAPAPVVRTTSAKTYLDNDALAAEVFGAAGLVVRYADTDEAVAVIDGLEGQLTATLHAGLDDRAEVEQLLPHLEGKVGRILWGGWPTGVEVSHAMVHGGPFPATSAPATTSVGTLAIDRFTRPVCYQSFPDELLPEPLRADNPAGLTRRVDGVLETAG